VLGNALGPAAAASLARKLSRDGANAEELTRDHMAEPVDRKGLGGPLHAGPRGRHDRIHRAISARACFAAPAAPGWLS
jgi:hypothetical protein